MKEKKIWPYFGNSHETSSAYFEEMRPKAKGNWASYWLFDDFEPQKYRDFKKLIQLTALVLRAVKNFKTGTRGEEPMAFWVPESMLSKKFYGSAKCNSL